jgi:hypothetical protein
VKNSLNAWTERLNLPKSLKVVPMDSKKFIVKKLIEESENF